jgi:ethanolamine utilization protein EutA (predicted chaperonin)
LLNEKVIDKLTYRESIVSKCIEQLLDPMDHVENLGIEEIVEIIREFAEQNEEVVDKEKVQLQRLVMKWYTIFCFLIF